MKILTKGLTYQGHFIKGKKYSLGDVVDKDGHTLIFDGESFVEIGNVVTYEDKTTHDVRIVPIKCKCCGAPLTWQDELKYGTCTCPYCGTMYSIQRRRNE
jgi:hypothetical protein